MTGQIQSLIDGIKNRNQQCIARAISILADRRPGWDDIMDAVWSTPSRSTFIGITGAPGSGKSTLAESMISAYRARDARVGVVAVDPSSPFSGGAILGDRLRMQNHAADPDVFIRSMASRGRLGGLAPATAETAALLSMAGYDPVLIETVGVGQSEVDVMSIADVVLMVLVPGNGDSIQAMKAGVMEAGDIFVLNQSDRPGADRLLAEVQAALHLAGDDAESNIVRTVATEGSGVAELIRAIDGLNDRLRTDCAETLERAKRRFTRLVSLAVHDALDSGFDVFVNEHRESIPETGSWKDAVNTADLFFCWMRHSWGMGKTKPGDC